MSKSLIERRLRDLSAQLKRLRSDLTVADEQLAHFRSEADEARLRSLVSETALADRDSRDASRHAEAMERHRSQVAAEIAELERTQDELLDRLAE
ncbi:MAG: hypothetical protein HKN26_13775 [Acidimicrobiales bacterium]|nr:hypothetical protein [Acidimicrobiales bacterium]